MTTIPAGGSTGYDHEHSAAITEANSIRRRSM